MLCIDSRKISEEGGTAEMDFLDFVECTYANDLEFDSNFNTRPKGSGDKEDSSDDSDSD